MQQILKLTSYYFFRKDATCSNFFREKWNAKTKCKQEYHLIRVLSIDETNESSKFNFKEIKVPSNCVCACNDCH